ncbi:hypothetical protein CC78DRAFT_568771 [Lojkania enalia]|uniref:Uncharacterized protein n=1 Tax=Lojkania enalia TaxID=147567 RepID=A0A9P4KCS9_9PLEO|nr:hypothetical protein CC78DRAFT_568771 [Didymosphaeria enalia]
MFLPIYASTSQRYIPSDPIKAERHRWASIGDLQEIHDYTPPEDVVSKKYPNLAAAYQAPLDAIANDWSFHHWIAVKNAVGQRSSSGDSRTASPGSIYDTDLEIALEAGRRDQRLENKRSASPFRTILGSSPTKRGRMTLAYYPESALFPSDHRRGSVKSIGNLGRQLFSRYKESTDVPRNNGANYNSNSPTRFDLECTNQELSDEGVPLQDRLTSKETVEEDEDQIKIDPKKFRPVAEYLSTGNFHLPFGDVDQRKGDAIGIYAEAWEIALHISLDSLMAMIVEKMEILQPWPLFEGFSFALRIYSEKEVPFEADREMRKLLSSFIAVNFRRYMDCPTYFWQEFQKFPELREQVYTRLADEAKKERAQIQGEDE